MTLAQTGALLGAVGGGGALLAFSAAPRFRRARLDARLGPYVSDTPRPSRLLAGDGSAAPYLPVGRALRPVLRDAARRLDSLLGGSSSVRRRLERAGGTLTLEEFRGEQIVWGGAGLLAGILLSLLTLTQPHPPSPVAMLLLCFSLVIAGVVARDQLLSRKVKAREQRMLAEFPTVAELLALAVAAGESPIGALERVTRLSTGELARELGRGLADARAGATLIHALDGIAARTSLSAVARFVDGIAIAVERGTPLAEVLRAQAMDVREAGKRALLEASGKKELAMMAPVVFLILPVIVLFLLYPGFYNLNVAVH